MKVPDILAELRSQANPKNVAGMARFGINAKNTLGVSIPALRALTKRIRKDSKGTKERHELAKELWQTELHEARILAGMVDEPLLVTEKQMDAWIRDFDSWDICDQVCMNLFDKTPFALDKAIEWTARSPEFEKRSGFALMACLSWHDKKAEDSRFSQFFPSIKAESQDERNFVKKAVNWALRQIGKRNAFLRKQAIICAKEIQKLDSRSARWIAGDALRELTNSKK
ncbi:DNA alkylation repair protein [Patescibacteria group bacterium]|nr:DNA alkylation repair protein [Patescibacteria group bacterium]MBU1472565.1 DNA alkylation repair protein [Patescibacteria group bacterium]MBU2459816.1 DNA alkylation repair protein [Patescibacteria group bacterium]MBU2544122.1 DNA alkylation repair protein [Patescibacteria group bacterium]